MVRRTIRVTIARKEPHKCPQPHRAENSSNPPQPPSPPPTIVRPANLFAENSTKLNIKKAVNLAMIETKGSAEEKFNLIKSVGFQGVEINAPGGFDRNEVIKAAEKTGIIVHGVVDSDHWKDCLSDPDAAIRAKGVTALRAAIDDAHAMGASTVLLVPGRVTKDITYDEVWKRSHEEIEKVIPYAKEKGVKIAIEVVWNGFITKPNQFVEFVDSFNTPIVGAYFDIGNVVIWSPPAPWIDALGSRILKLHVKGYSLQKRWVDIGEGDEKWPDVRSALAKANYTGWATAEVKGGGEDVLRDISKRMDNVLGLGQ